MANKILVYIYQGLSQTEIAKKFKTPSKPNGINRGMVSDVLRRVFGLNFKDMKKIIDPNVLPYIMLEKSEANIKNFFDISKFTGNHISTETYRRLNTALGRLLQDIRAGNQGFTQEFQSMRPNSALARKWVKLALVGPLLETMIRAGCSITEIRESLIGIYHNEAQLVQDLQIIFGGLPAKFFHSNILGLSHYESILPTSFIRFIDTAFNLYSSIS